MRKFWSIFLHKPQQPQVPRSLLQIADRQAWDQNKPEIFSIAFHKAIKEIVQNTTRTEEKLEARLCEIERKLSTLG